MVRDGHLFNKVLLLLVLTMAHGLALSADQNDWEDAYFRVPFQSGGGWLPTSLYIKLSLRHPDMMFEAFKQAAQSDEDVAFSRLLEVGMTRDNSIATGLLISEKGQMSDSEMAQILERFHASLKPLTSMRVLYVIPMQDAYLYVVSATEAGTEKQTRRLFRLTKTESGRYAYIIGRSYDDSEALINRVFAAGATEPEIFAQIPQEDIATLNVNYGLAFTPSEVQQKIGIAVPYELLLDASRLDIPVLKGSGEHFESPAVIDFYRDAYTALSKDKSRDSINRYFDTDSAEKLDRAFQAQDPGTVYETMLSEFQPRRIKLLIDADPLWILFYIKTVGEPGTGIDLYHTEMILKKPDGPGFEITELYALPLLKSLLATEHVQREGIDKIVRDDFPALFVRKIERPDKGYRVYYLVGILLLIMFFSVYLMRQSHKMKNKSTG